MQKALEMMNIKLHAFICDLTGQTGMATVEAIIKRKMGAESFLITVVKRQNASHNNCKISTCGGSSTTGQSR
jgi:hypothetical protein